MSSVPPKSNTNVLVAPEPPSFSQPSQGSSEGPNQRTPHSRANKKGPSKTVTLADAVQKTVVLSYKVLRVDVNREHGQIKKVGETRLKLRLEDLARVPPVGIIKGLLVWPDNRVLLHVHIHVYRFCVLSWGPIFSATAVVGGFWIIGGQHVFCVARRLASEREKKNLDPSRWQLEFECMVLKWDTPLRQTRRLAGHQQTAQHA